MTRGGRSESVINIGERYGLYVVNISYKFVACVITEISTNSLIVNGCKRLSVTM